MIKQHTYLYRISSVLFPKDDESIISVFNIIFESISFIFDFILLNIISFLELFYFNCKLFNFMNKYSKDSVLEQKKEDLELIWAKNTMIQHKNISPPSQKLGMARATSHKVVPAPGRSFAASASRTSYLLIYF